MTDRNDTQSLDRSASAAGPEPAAGAAAAAPPDASRLVPARAYDVALLDLDGVVYRGQAAIGGAVPALAMARATGMRLAFVTNNSSRSPSTIAAHLSGLGVPARSADVVTSAQAAASLLAARVPAGSPVLVVGAIGLRLALHARGFRPVSTAAQRPAAVVQGYAPDLSYGLLAEAAVAIRNGALYVASNADTTLPTPRGLAPGNGSLLQVLITATGVRPLVAGKPEPPLHAEAVARTGARRPLVVGDRLDTDIEGAVRGGADSMLVLTGVSTPIQVVLAPPAQRPTYLAADLSGLIEPQPAIGPGGDAGTGLHADGGTGPRRDVGTGRRWDGDAAAAMSPDGAEARHGAFGCGGWEARREASSGQLTLAGEGSWLDGLRALCTAAWSTGPVAAEDVRQALARLGLG